jgi:hypothetical protein
MSFNIEQILVPRLLMFWHEHNFLNLHLVEDIVAFDCLTQWHELIRHEAS